MPGNFPRSPGVKDLRTRRVLERLADLTLPGGGGMSIGGTVTDGVAELLLYIDSNIKLAQTDLIRYHANWQMTKNNGQPVLADLADDEFTFSFVEA